MKTSNYLLPYSFKKIGFILFCMTFVFLIVSKLAGEDLLSVTIPSFSGFGFSFGMNKVVLDSTVVIVFGLASLMFMAQSQEKIEDECISSIRARAFALALWITGAILLFSSIFCYDFAYLNVLIVNIFAYLILLVFIQRMMIFRFNKINEHE